MGDHKTAHRGRIRAIPLTKQAQDILRPRIEGIEPATVIFSPADTIREMRQRRSAKRQTPVGQGNSEGTNKRLHPMITPGDQYATTKLQCQNHGGLQMRRLVPLTNTRWARPWLVLKRSQPSVLVAGPFLPLTNTG